MFSDTDQLIHQDETVQEKTHPSRLDFSNLKWLTLSFIYIFAVVGSLGYLHFIGRVEFRPVYLTLLIPGILVILYLEVKRHFITYYFTTEKIIKERGILNKETTTVEYGNITHVDLEKNFEDRIFDVGNIHVNTAGTHKSEQIMNGIRNPESYRVIISESKDGSSYPEEETENVRN